MDWKKKEMPKAQKTSLQAVTRLLPQRLMDEEADDEDDRQSDKQLRHKLEKYLHNYEV